MKRTNIRKRLIREISILLLMTLTLISTIPDSLQAKEVRSWYTTEVVGEKMSVDPVACYGSYDPHKGAKVKYSSSDNKIATVDSNGTVTITAKVGSKTYKCKIKVKKACNHTFRPWFYSQCLRCFNKYYANDEECNCIAGSRQAFDSICTKCGYIYESSYL